MNKKYFLIPALFLLSGCVYNFEKIEPNDPSFAPVSPQQLVPTAQNNGSLFQEGFSLSLYQDNTAQRVGDILTVKLAEEMTSTSNTTTAVNRKTEIDAPNPTILGGTPAEISLPGLLPFSGLGSNAQVSVDQENKYSGTGSGNDGHNLSDGFITVTVSEVYPNGNMRIRGEKWIMLNGDERYIRLSGIVRPEDISQYNVIQSINIADARVSYGGKGLISEHAQPGWLSRVVLSPLWPF